MSQFTVQGYHNGVAYGLAADTDHSDDLNGIVTQGPAEVIAAVEAQTGQPAVTLGTGPEVEIGVTTADGLMAGLMQVTEVVSVTGDAPDVWTGGEPPTGPVVH
jgi:hypothetical protein